MADIIEHHNESRKFNDLCTVVVCLSSFSQGITRHNRVYSLYMAIRKIINNTKSDRDSTHDIMPCITMLYICYFFK